MQKAEIVHELGESPLLLPAYIDTALQANNQVKYFFTLLQEARHYADHPEAGITDLRTERTAAGITDTSLDSIISNCQRTADNKYYIPHITDLHEQIVKALNDMLMPVQTGLDKTEFNRQQQRLEKLLKQVPDFSGDEVSTDYIDMATRGQRNGADSLHLLVMDLHKLINQLQAGLAEETLDGARAYNITDADRKYIKAFMAGLNSTAPLKFDHPGLDTTATHSGNRLILQNDIGTTDAHVLVIHVEELTVTLTYTDVHEQRLDFFESLFEKYNVNWQDTRAQTGFGEKNTDDNFYLCIGTFVAASDNQLTEYLHFLGSRLVFLIDWNKARKRLRNFIKKRDRLALLKWAADNNFGHRGFLQVGGERIIYEALAQISSAKFHYGDRLDEILGHKNAIEFLKFVMQTAATGLLQGRTERFIHDEIKAEIFNYFQSAEEDMYEICADHAANILDMADAVNNIFIQNDRLQQGEPQLRTAALVKRLETRADDLLNQVRDTIRRTGEGSHLRHLTEEADDVADALEEVAYLLTLLPDTPVETMITRPLQSLSDLIVKGCRNYIQCIEMARGLEEKNIREDRQSFFETVNNIMMIEHQTDTEERQLLKLLLQQDTDAKLMHLLSRIGQIFEEAADSLSHCALILKDYIINSVITHRE